MVMGVAACAPGAMPARLASMAMHVSSLFIRWSPYGFTAFAD
jgi:hypothetical protein